MTKTAILERIESIEGQIAENRLARRGHEDRAEQLLKEITKSFDSWGMPSDIIDRTNEFKHQMNKMQECDTKHGMLSSQLKFMVSIVDES